MLAVKTTRQNLHPVGSANYSPSDFDSYIRQMMPASRSGAPRARELNKHQAPAIQLSSSIPIPYPNASYAAISTSCYDSAIAPLLFSR